MFEIGVVYENLEQYEEALTYFQHSLSIDQELGTREDETLTLYWIGWVYSQLEKYEEALNSFQKSLTICQEFEIKEDESDALYQMGLIYFNPQAISKRPQCASEFLSH